MMPQSKDKFFADDGEDITYWPTAELAKQEAQRAIDTWKRWGGDEWPEEVERVCWGEVRQVAKEKIVLIGDEQKECADYHLKDV